MNTLAILRGTFGNFRPPLLTTSATWLLTTTTNRLYRKRLYAFPKLRSFGGTFGNFQPLSSITSACVNRFIQTYHYLEHVLSWTPKCLCQIAFNVMNALAILGGTFNNFRSLSLTTSAWSISILTYHYFERALWWTLKYFGGTFGNFRLLIDYSLRFIWVSMYLARKCLLGTLYFNVS